ncbi:glyoxalase [Pseudovibrio japonicus]|uniref:Bleomycin resistance protein n=1 Tax=Pseudovibrio japonicus TaxID=366534 RepID=A0ABQ3EMI4_9HYPH|nr:VOC family protein [Pseudovibrio japonicus]GHB47003.1 glyoxalase [Pseudovibrio japonicus]
MSSALVPEFAVSDWFASKHFYCEVLGFECLYERPEEGFCYLSLGAAEIMIDQIGLGRTFDTGHAPKSHPFGKGLNVQIEVETIEPLLNALRQANIPLFLQPEDKWYRKGQSEVGNRQFIVADPDGYLLRFCQTLGSREI